MTTVCTLPNGLRTVVDRLAPTQVVAVSVAYRAGMRADPDGSAGLAHLVEHASFGALAEYTATVDAVGGSTSAATHTDHTEFATVVPAGAVPEVLRLEAARMRLTRISPEELARQVRVLDEEVRTQIDSQDFAGHTVRDLPPLLLGEGLGDGYGSAAALAHLTPRDVEEFAARHYRPSTAVVALAGDLDPAAGLAMVEQAFGEIDAGGGPSTAVDRPWSSRDGLPLATRAGGASAPAAVRGFALPPSAPADRHLATYLSAVLALRAAAELRGFVCRAGVFEPLATRSGDLGFLGRYLTAGEDPRRVAEDVDSTLAEVAAGRLQAGTVQALTLRWRRRLEEAAAEPLARARGLARGLALHDDADLPEAVLRALAHLDEEQVAGGAAWLREAPGAQLHLLPRQGEP